MDLAQTLVAFGLVSLAVACATILIADRKAPSRGTLPAGVAYGALLAAASALCIIVGLIVGVFT